MTSNTFILDGAKVKVLSPDDSRGYEYNRPDNKWELIEYLETGERYWIGKKWLGENSTTIKPLTLPTNAEEVNALIILAKQMYTKEQRMRLFGSGMTNGKMVEIMNAELKKRNENG